MTRDQTVFGQQQNTVGRSWNVTLLTGVDDDSSRIGNQSSIATCVSNADVMVAAILICTIIEKRVVDFKVPIESIQKRCDAHHSCRTVVALESRAVEFVVASEKSDVHIRDIKPGTVASRNGDRESKNLVFHPDTVLKNQRHDTSRERQIERQCLTNRSACDCSKVAFHVREIEVRVTFEFVLVVVKNVS